VTIGRVSLGGRALSGTSLATLARVASLASLAGLASASFGAASCLPVPPKRAVVDVTLRGGPREVALADGYLLRFERRIAIVGVGTTSTSGSGGGGTAQIRNLDVPPFDLVPLRPRDERFVFLFTQSFYEREPRGPGVTDEDVDVLDGSDAGPHAVVGTSDLLARAVLERGGESWTFDLGAGAASYAGVVCGELGAAGLGPLVFEAESHHTVEVVLELERWLALAPGAPPLGQPLVDGDLDRDHVITPAELAHVFEVRSPAGVATSVFDVTFDGQPLVCRPPSATF
jgi:hypothetical protein